MGDISEHFSRDEFECSCGCGFDTVDALLLQILEDLRVHFKKPIRINSACRCESHNANVGGSPKSQHRLGRAADIVVKDTDPAEVYDYLETFYPYSLGLGNYKTFTHLDTRSGIARW